MHSKRTNLWIGFTIGILAALLLSALAILFIPRLRPILGLNATNLVNKAANTTNTTNTANAAANTANTSNDLLNRPAVKTQSENISVTSPAPYAEISSPVTVGGSARVFENQVSLKLLDGDGQILAESFAMTSATDAGVFGPFTTSLAYKQNKFATGMLEVFQTSAADGSEIDKVTIPVTFATSAGI